MPIHVPEHWACRTCGSRHRTEQGAGECEQRCRGASPEATQLASRLLACILKRKPDFRTPNMKQWAMHADRMIRLDKRKPADIAEVIDWCQADDFWQNNILSTAKLRKQYDQLQLRIEQALAKKVVRCHVCTFPCKPGDVGPDGICKTCRRHIAQKERERMAARRGDTGDPRPIIDGLKDLLHKKAKGKPSTEPGDPTRLGTALDTILKHGKGETE